MAQTEPSQSTGRDAGTNPAEGFGPFKVDLADHLDVTTIQRLSTLLRLTPKEIDSIMRSKTPGLEMVYHMEMREFITPTDISHLIDSLHELKLAGLAARIQSSFQAKISQGKKDHGLDLEVEHQEEKRSDVSSKGKASDSSSVKQPSTSASDRVVTTAAIQDLSRKILYEWRIVGRKLGIGEPKLQIIDTDNSIAPEKVYEMLLTWKQSEGYKATYRLLGEALQSAGRKDLQEYLHQQEDKSGDVSSKGKLNYPWLKGTLTVLLSKNDCHQLARHVALPKYQLDAIINSDSSAKDLLDILEERGVIHTSNVSRLLEAVSVLKINEKALLMLERYQRSRGSEPQWDEQSNTHYELGEHNRVTEIQRFSWKNIQETFKNIVVYAAGRDGPTDSMYLDIGYFWDLVTCVEVSKRNNASLLHKQRAVFKKDWRPLTISIDKFEPVTWTCSEGTNPQVISFDKVAINKGTFCTFVLNRTEPKGSDACICYCKVGQAPNLQDFIFQLKAPDPPSVKQPSTLKRQEDERVGTSTAGIEAPDLVVTTDIIEDLYDKFCDEWRIVGRKLGIGEPKLQTIDRDNREAQEKVLKMLSTWKKSKGSEANYRLLGEALQSAGRKDLQEYLYQQGVEQQEDKSSDGSSKGKLNYPWLKSSLTVLLSKNDCHQLARHVALSKYQLDAIINSDSSAKDLLDVLEERGVIHPFNVSRLLEAIRILKINQTAMSLLERYQKSRGDETSYGRFLAGLSSHLTLSLPRKLCDYFEFTSEKKKAVITSKTPGISFLLTLEDMGVINPLDVGKLVTPLKQYQLVQAVAKVQEYQTLVDERSELTKPIHTLEGKQALFIECLRKKTKSWYETMTPLPWKKSCKWMASELFIACGLVLTNSKAKMKTTNVDPKSKLQYTDILTHERLKSATRIIIEGDPGSGKTMLSSQLAYDWSIGKNSDARMVVFLPLKSVYGMTIIEAIKQFYIPKDKPLTEDDIKAILDKASDENKTCIVLDGLEEYNGRTKDGEPSEVERVMRKEKFPNCTVVLTSRSDFVHGLPQCPMLKLGRFGEEERDQYINNIIPEDPQRQQNVKRSTKTFALLNDLCSIPLLFVYIVHNIEHLGQIDKPRGQLDSVGPFMEVMVNNLLSLSRSEGSESEIMSTRLSEIAFNGLCKGYQQLMWPKSFLDENVSNVKDWIQSGILVVEEGETAKEKEHQKKIEAVDEGMVTQDEIISVDDERREGGSSSEAAMIGEGQDDILSSDEESPRDRESSTDNKPSETEKPFTERKTSTDPQNLSLQVKFLHKVIQEWFAAKHFSSMLQRSKRQYRHRLFLNRHLPLINPADLHYLLRFTSYLCPENSYLIMEHLHSFYKSSKGVVPEYILNCIFLCFIECKSSVGKKKMENTVRQVCENIVTIRGEDSRLLQQSKVSMLTYASNSEICIGTLRLVDLVVEVTKETLTFNSSITLEFFPTLKVIEVSQWDMRLKEEDFEELIKFITNCKLLNNAFLNFPSPPPLLTNKKLLSSMKKNLTIEWIIGERVIHTLDKESGEWPMQFRSTPHQTTDQVLSKSLRVMLMINKKGGRLDIPDTGVSLEIPSGALEGEQFIQMIIIPPHLESESLTFASNSSLVVELLPSNLNLLKPAKLTIPHCLVLKKGCEWKAKIYRSHHKEGSKPQWEEQSTTPYKLGEQNCVIDIQRFSWEKFEVDGQIVEAKNIIMYAAVRCGTTDTIYLDFGYYLNLATFEEVSKRNNASLLHEQPTVFKKEGKSLNILLEKFEPMNWTYSEGNNPQEILYSDVAISPWYFCTFVLKKTETNGTDACTCYCKAGQAPNLRNFIFQLKAPDPSSVKQPSTSETQEAVRVERFTAGIEAPDLVVSTDTIEARDPSSVKQPSTPASDRVVTTAAIQNLSRHFCHEWVDVSRILGIEEATRLDIQRRNVLTRHQAYEMLDTWKKSKGEKATNKLLGEALIAAGRRDMYEKFIPQD